MKTVIRTILVVFISTFLLTGCVKSVGIISNPIVGSWVLNDASKGNATGWRPLYTGLENGVFTFYNNGSASYNDGFSNYQGSWLVTNVSTGYYDYYGNYYTNYHDALEVRLKDYSTNSTINLYFDDVDFANANYFTGTYYSNNYIERYGFSRY